MVLQSCLRCQVFPADPWNHHQKLELTRSRYKELNVLIHKQFVNLMQLSLHSFYLQNTCDCGGARGNVCLFFLVEAKIYYTRNRGGNNFLRRGEGVWCGVVCDQILLPYYVPGLVSYGTVFNLYPILLLLLLFTSNYHFNFSSHFILLPGSISSLRRQCLNTFFLYAFQTADQHKLF